MFVNSRLVLCHALYQLIRQSRLKTTTGGGLLERGREEGLLEISTCGKQEAYWKEAYALERLPVYGVV